MAGARLGARRHFREHQPAFVHRLLPRLVLGRVKDVDPAGDDADRAALQRPVVRGAVDAPGQARDDQQPLLPKVVRQPPRKPAGRRAGVAGADDCHRLPVEQVEVTLGHEQGRRIFELGKQPGIETLPEYQILAAKLLDPRDLALGGVAGA